MDTNVRSISIAIVLAVSLSVASALAYAETTVKEFRGTGNSTTSMFIVEGPWLLDWRLDGDYESMVALDLTLVEARTGKHIGRVVHTKRRGNGLKIFDEGGQYQLRISSTLARWTIRIKQIEPEEAKRYVPKKNY